MAKNTGAGSRAGSQSRPLREETTWIKNDYLVGKFKEAKKNGGNFKGILYKSK